MTQLCSVLGIEWGFDRVVFDVSNPHPEFAMLPAEYAFVTRGGSNDDAFNPDSPVSSGLQEMIVLYSGTVDTSRSGGIDFQPLIQTGYESGILAWEEFVDEGGLNFFTMQATANPRRNPPRRIDSDVHSIAARVTGSGDGGVNAIFVSDIDMISDFFFDERSLGNLDITFDNVTFVLNAVDLLAGDESFIGLRSRRPKHRTLTRVEEKRREFLEAANQAERDADEAADKELEVRRDQLSARVKEIQENEDLDPIAKSQMLRQAQEAEQQRMTLAEAKIEQTKNDEIRKIRARTNNQVRAFEAWIRVMAVLLPAIPAVLMGIVWFVRRLSDERATVGTTRRRDERRQD